MLHVERSFDAVVPALRNVLQRLARGEERWPLYLYGDSGLGKTCAALALADFVDTACYWTAEDLASFVLKSDPVDVEYEHKFIAEKSLAILDEIGTREKVGDLGYSVVKRFADLREQEKNRVAIYISNVAPQRLIELYDDRVYSRLTCGTVIELTGRDRRSEAKS